MAPWSGQIGQIGVMHGDRGRSRLDREVSCARRMIKSPGNGESRLKRFPQELDYIVCCIHLEIWRDR
jgi:hypothetical protein